VTRLKAQRFTTQWARALRSRPRRAARTLPLTVSTTTTNNGEGVQVGDEPKRRSDCSLYDCAFVPFLHALTRSRHRSRLLHHGRINGDNPTVMVVGTACDNHASASEYGWARGVGVCDRDDILEPGRDAVSGTNTIYANTTDASGTQGAAIHGDSRLWVDRRALGLGFTAGRQSARKCLIQ